MINQTLEICLEAVKQNSETLRYVRKQTLEIILTVLEQDKKESLICINWDILTEEEFEYIKIRYLL